MKAGTKEWFCNCLLKNLKDHTTATDEEGVCLYCGYYAFYREVTEKDLRSFKKFGKELDKLKMEALDVSVKDKRHGKIS